MTYRHRKPPQDVKSLPAFIDRELLSIEQEFISPRDFAQLTVLHVPPARPREGMVVCADGSDWQPLAAGGGFFGYFGGAWNKLG